MKQLRYKGEFVDRTGNVWRAEILQESPTAFAAVGSLDFDGDDPLTIEWENTSKEVPICGSAGTLKIISPSDRTYEDLYTIKPGSIRLDVYKNEQLYWSGALDPEFYEEPYEKTSNYTVTLTFSDFGILGRLRYNLFSDAKMLYSLREIIDYCLQRSTINYTDVNTTYVSTTSSGATAFIFNSVKVRADNFVDEDGELSTLEDVLEGILQPLSLRIVQRCGVIYVYDINAICKSTQIGNTPIVWAGDAQTMGTDKVYNNVQINFSPYANADLLTGEEIQYGGKYGEEYFTAQHGVIESTTGSWSEYYKFGEQKGDTDNADFAIFTSTKGRGATIGKDCRYCKIFPLRGGASECDAVAYDFKVFANNNWHDEDVDHWAHHHGVQAPNALPAKADPLVMKLGGMWLPQVQNPDQLKLNITESILIDCRYNPFSSATENNFDENNHKLRINSGYVYVPFSLILYREDTGEAYAYMAGTGGDSATGRWVKKRNTDPREHIAYLEYYDADDIRENAGVGNGWGNNSRNISRPDLYGHTADKIKEAFSRIKGKGDPIPYPPFGGRLEINIYAGVFGYDFQYDKNPSFSDNSQWHIKKVYDLLRWALYKCPEIQVVQRRILDSPVESDDIEYSAYINKDAQEDLSIDTICGTLAADKPTARGQFFYHNLPLQSLRRYDNAAQAYKEMPVERLLTGTLFSQFATRHIKLNGEAEITAGLHRYTEANQGRKVFLLSGEVQNIRLGFTDAEYIEISPDTFDGIEEKQND